jgi:DNA-binding transcriptional ArsR family regulator
MMTNGSDLARNGRWLVSQREGERSLAHRVSDLNVLQDRPGNREYNISIFPEILLTIDDQLGILAIMNLADAAARLEALGNPTRLSIYRLLVRAGDAGMPVGRIQDQLGLAASTLSHHLKSLLIVGLATQERDSRTLICRANYPMMRGLVDYLVDECCADAGCAPNLWERRETVKS